jgi:two-component system chemotaxis sensor kinase CheA
MRYSSLFSRSPDTDLVNNVFRAIHTIKGSAGFFSLDNIKNLAHAMENVLGLIRNRELICSPDAASLLLEGADLLKKMLDNIDAIGSFDPTPIIENLAKLTSADKGAAAPPQSQATSAPANPDFKDSHGTVVVKFERDRMQALQRADKGGQYIYGLQWNLGSSEATPSIPIVETVKVLAQYCAFGPVVVRCSAEEDAFARSAALFMVISTVIEPALFYDIVSIDKSAVTVLAEKLIRDTPPPAAAPAPVIQPKPEIAKAAAPVPVADKKEDPAQPGKAKAEGGSIRVNLEQLDRLMSMAGELVLARNALLRKVNELDDSRLSTVSQQIDAITSELQEAIMATRMQTVGIIFTKFKRVVRDLSRSLDKKIDLTIEGEDVELDKTIIEALNDPLTHLVRNSADHGIETPRQRIASGKSEVGNLALTARHEAGHVIIEIADDGAGIDPQRIRAKALEKRMITKEEAGALSDREMVRFIFKPGFSTAEKVTEVSGRGVGMDVVLSNLSKVGGAVDIESAVGKGTKIIIKLPLTLAIIPSILVSVNQERFAIPQLNVVELVRVAAADVKKRIETIGDSAVIRLRGVLVPLVRLADVLAIEKQFHDAATGVDVADRRQQIADRRSLPVEIEVKPDTDAAVDKRSDTDRRISRLSAVNIMVVTAGVQRFGLIIDQFLDSEEIVVKPIGSHLKECREYAGATILGDGSVAFILNIAGISASAQLTNLQEEIDSVEARRRSSQALCHDAQTYVIVRNNASEQFAIPLGVISRIERFKSTAIASIGGQSALSYGDSMLALLSIEEMIGVLPRTPTNDLFVVVFRSYGRDVGVMVSQIVDIVDLTATIDISTYVRPGVLGSVVIDGVISLILDLHAFVDAKLPEYKTAAQKRGGNRKTVLIVEDSPFFLRQLKSILVDNECQVITATNGEEGLEALRINAETVDLLFTDIEMPIMDGVEMTKKIRSESRFRQLPIIAVTSLSGDNAEKRAREAGISEYLIKLDREQILERCQSYL